MCGPVKPSRVWWWWELLKVTSHTHSSLSLTAARTSFAGSFNRSHVGSSEIWLWDIIGLRKLWVLHHFITGRANRFSHPNGTPLTWKISTRLIVNWNFISRRNPYFCCNLVKIPGLAQLCVRWVAPVRCKSGFFSWIFFAHLKCFLSTWHRGHNLPPVQDIWRILILVSKCFLRRRHGCLSSLIRGTGIISEGAHGDKCLEEAEIIWDNLLTGLFPDALRVWHPGQGRVSRGGLEGVWDIFMRLTPG